MMGLDIFSSRHENYHVTVPVVLIHLSPNKAWESANLVRLGDV